MSEEYQSVSLILVYQCAVGVFHWHAFGSLVPSDEGSLQINRKLFWVMIILDGGALIHMAQGVTE